MSQNEMFVRTGVGLVLFSALMALTYYPPVGEQGKDTVEFVIMALGGLIGHSANAKSSQGGTP